MADKPLFTEEDFERARLSAYEEDGSLTPEAQALANRGVNQIIQRQEAENLKTNPEIFKLVIQEFDKRVVGENDTKRAIFLCCCGSFVSNLDIYPHAFINSESSAGKSYITRNIFEIFPEKMKCYRTRISPRVLDYWHNSKFEPEWDWNGKILYLEDVEANVLNSDTLKVMASEGSHTTMLINQRAVDIEIKGKPIIIVTTCEAEPKTETLNRFCSVTLDLTKQQTHAVNLFKAKLALNGNLPEYNPAITYFLDTLKRVKVSVPFAEDVVSCFPIDDIAMRRIFPFFLALIRCSAALHQFQREVKRGEIVANGQDYNIARSVLCKVQPYSKMASLTHRQKKAYEYCLEITNLEECFKASEIVAKYPEFSERMWQRHLQKLSAKGFLQTTREPDEGKGRPALIYKANLIGKLELPKYENLN